MSENILHALVLIQNWGEKDELLSILKSNNHVISAFHIMGRFSYLIDTNFDNKAQLEVWINKLKSAKTSSDMPAIISLQTQKVINVYKHKENFNLKDYSDLKDKDHFFMMIDNPHHDEELIELLNKIPSVHSVLHIQGRNSFIVEVITESYNNFRNLLSDLKLQESIRHIETLEVISVIKYRNQVLDGVGKIVFPEKDIRELFTL